MNSTLPRPRDFTAGTFGREACPPGFDQWLPEGKLGAARLGLEEWRVTVTQRTEQFRINVHEKDSPTLWDLRQHRTHLLLLIAWAEKLAVEVLSKWDDAETARFVDEIDSDVKRLWLELVEWHAPVEAKISLPDELVGSFAELDSGNVVAFGMKQTG